MAFEKLLYEPPERNSVANRSALLNPVFFCLPSRLEQARYYHAHN